jgi:hypothetical protein
LVFGHAVPDSIQKRVYVTDPLRIAGNGELPERIHANQHDRGKYGEHADDDKYFNKREGTRR